MEKRNGIIVFLDALGTRTLSSDEAVKFLASRNKVIEQTKKLSESVSSLSKIKGVKYGLESLLFGDSLVLHWHAPENSRLLMPSVALLLNKIMAKGFENGILWRGAVTTGEYVFDGNSIIGPAVAEAVDWEKKANWIGIIASHKCGFQIESIREEFPPGGEKESFAGWFVKYPVPLKDSTEELWTITWPCSYHSGSEGISQLFQQLGNCKFPPETLPKYLNTKDYFIWYKNLNFPFSPNALGYETKILNNLKK